MRSCNIITALTLLSACSGDLSETGALDEGDAELVQLEQPISGGAQVSDAENLDPTKPFGPVVRINGNCTATKIGRRRFITATHCLGLFRESIRITNARDGVSNEITANILLHLRHPSALLGFITEDELIDPGLYEVSVFDIDRDTNIPVRALVSGQVIPFGTGNLTMVGYGCDDQGSNDFLKQKGTFSTTQGVNTTTDVHYLSEGTSLNGCPGDSGGPLFRQSSSGTWSIVGIHTGGAIFVRLGNVFEWLNSPAVNLFSDNQTGAFMNVDVVEGVNSNTVNCLSISADGNVRINHCDNPEGFFSGGNHKPGWRLVASEFPGGFRIVNRNNGHCLTVNGTGSNNSDVVATTCALPPNGPFTTRQSQSWTFVDRGEVGTGAPVGTDPIHGFAITGRGGTCLGTTSNSTAIGADVRVFTCNSFTQSQEWVFTR